ncbi:MAG: cadherin-like domain-containing protein, partial [Oligoflexales bacterium]|nr:cadherin-like domain-containing protein [Oligoflexales bacterium]
IDETVIANPSSEPELEAKPESKIVVVLQEEAPFNAQLTQLILLEDADATTSRFVVEKDPELKFKITDVEKSSLGDLTLMDDGYFTFDAFANIYGEEKLVFKVESEKGDQSQNILHLRIESVNDRPVLKSLSLNGKQDEAIIGKVVGSDVDGDELSFFIVENKIENGDLDLNKDTGEFVFTPSPGFFGQTSFMVTVFDGALNSDPAQVSLFFEKAPDVSTPFQVCSNMQSSLYPIRVQAFTIPAEYANNQFKLKNQIDLGIPFGEFCMNEINIPMTHFEDGFKKEDGSSLGVTEWFVLELNTSIEVKEASYYDFQLNSDDGAILYINDQEIIDNDGVHSQTIKDSATNNTSPFLAVGRHNLKIHYFQGPRHMIALQLAWKKVTATEYVQIPKETYLLEKK